MTAPSSVADERALLQQRAALTMRTVADQQQIIVGLQALVEALKARVAELEAAADVPRSAPALASTSPTSCSPTALAEAHEELHRLRVQNGRLVQSVATLQSERDSLLHARDVSESRACSLAATVADQASQLATHDAERAQWHTSLSRHQLLQTQHQQTEAELAALRADVDFERQIKTKWRALASTLVERADLTLQSQLQPRLVALREEERCYYQQQFDGRPQRPRAAPRRSVHANTAGGCALPPVQQPRPTPSAAALPLWSRAAAASAATGGEREARVPQ